MTDYKDIHGFQIEIRSSNPTNLVNGQVWYNTTNSKLRGATVSSVGAWSTGGTMNSARYALAGAGTQTSALGFGGTLDPPVSALVESYNGSAWTEVGDLNQQRYVLAGAGASNTAALAFGGFIPPRSAETETWNGTAWTEVADLNTARNSLAGDGTNTAAIAFGGASSTGKTEKWNGTSWAETSDLNTARYSLAGGGTYTSALAFGGFASPRTAVTESWNDTSWTEVADLNAARDNLMGTGSDNDNALCIGGYTNTEVNLDSTELWNGTSWSEQNNLSIGVRTSGATGTTAAAISFAGVNPSAGKVAVSEEWNVPFIGIREFDLS